ncbi:Non-canonical poly(A) RNA polymerase papd5 [Cichlidogyrus casuarinus]|uniref:polynucleotide adenylyltransferase n=1 Tax=Cichlidogyrus casuarinus TaxID=1844966 RepID=A0ABD2QF20_9PLAT
MLTSLGLQDDLSVELVDNRLQLPKPLFQQPNHVKGRFIYWNPEHASICSSMHIDDITDARIKRQIPKFEAYNNIFAEMHNDLMAQLNSEIRDFIRFISPTPNEQWAREYVITKVRNVIRFLWPHARVEVCGSFQTKLYLPTSDIDLVVFGNWDPNRLPLDILKTHIESSMIASSIKVLSRATVPIVKFIDKDTDIQVDISFNMDNSIRAVNLISDYLRLHPCLQSLVLVLKQFLQQRELNEVFTGGLGSYALILMCVSFLQHNVQPVGVDKVNLAVLLIEFLELYGNRFNYETTAIRVSDSGVYCRKDDVFVNAEMLCIQDPLNPDNDLGRRTFAMLQVRQSFEYAYTVLRSAVFPQFQSLHSNKSILGRIIRIPQRTLEKREQVLNFVDNMRIKITPYIAIPTSAVAKSSARTEPRNPSSSAPSQPTQSLSTPSAIMIAPSSNPSYFSSPVSYSNISFFGPPLPHLGFQFMPRVFPSQLIQIPPYAYHQAPVHVLPSSSSPSNQAVDCVVEMTQGNQGSYSSCSPDTSSKTSPVSSEDSSEEQVFAPEKRRPPPDSSNMEKTLLPSPNGDGPESSNSRIILEDCGVKSLVNCGAGDANNNSRVSDNPPTPFSNHDWPSASTTVPNNEETFPHPTIVSVTRKNRSQARKFDPRQYRLKGEMFKLSDPGIRKVESNRIQNNATCKNKAPHRSSSEENENRQKPVHETTAETNKNCGTGSKRKRVQSRKSQQMANKNH